MQPERMNTGARQSYTGSTAVLGKRLLQDWVTRKSMGPAFVAMSLGTQDRKVN